MPKIPEREWGNHGLDPESQEHNPTQKELQEDADLIKTAKSELFELRTSIGTKERDPYTYQESDFQAQNPEGMWDGLAYLHEDVIKNIKDPEERKKLEEELEQANKDIYRQYIPYLDTRINLYGQSNSPLEKFRSRFAPQANEIKSMFQGARDTLKHFDIPDDEKIEFEGELIFLEEKFNRYQAEPTLFTFEKIEKELFQKIDQEYIGDIYRIGTKKARSFGEDQASWQKTLDNMNKLIHQAHQLKEISSRMLNENIRKSCQDRAKSLLWQTESLKFKFEAPREFLSLEARIQELIQQGRNNEVIEDSKISDIKQEIVKLEKNEMNYDTRTQLERLKKLFEFAQKLFQGKKVFEEDEQVEISRENIYWAWERMGLEKEATVKDIKRAFRKLIKQYHPDRNKSEDAKEKMQRINEAYEFLARLKGFK